jgi:hypothetical protein
MGKRNLYTNAGHTMQAQIEAKESHGARWDGGGKEEECGHGWALFVSEPPTR